MSNMSKVHNYEHFSRFKRQGTGTTAAAGETRYDTWTVNGDDPSGEGSPKLNADGTLELDSNGNSTGNTQNFANSFTQRWGDQESYQVGNNYTELEGDAVTVVVGNSSTNRNGWTNNLTHGLTFNTQMGGIVTTALSFGVTSQVGFRCNTFVGAEVAINVAMTCKIAAGGYYQFGKAPDWGVSVAKTESVGNKTELSLSDKTLANEKVSVIGAGGLTVTVAGQVNEISVSQSTTVATKHSVTSAGTADMTGLAGVTVNSAAKVELKGAMVSVQGAVVNIGGGITNIG